jgi:hypothetical protein
MRPAFLQAYKYEQAIETDAEINWEKRFLREGICDQT